MIGQMAVMVTADRANFPLGTLFVRAGSAANVAILGVPVRAGVDVGGVLLRVENVDGATADFSARAYGPAWVVDLPASHFATVGGVAGGVSVWATGTGADGETSRTWCLGVGDLEVLTADADAPAPTPGQTFWPLRMFDSAPASPTKYNAYLDGGKLMVYDGAAWVEISGGSIDVDDSVTPAGVNPVKSSGIWAAIWGALAALPSGFSSLYDWCVAQLSGKRGKDDLAVYADGWSLLLAGASDRLVLLPTPQAGYWTDTGTMDGQNAIILIGAGLYRLLVADGTRGLARGVPEGAAEITFLDEDLESEVVAVATKQAVATSDTLAKTSQIPAVPSAATNVPLMDGAANAGASANYARADHVHPTDTTRASAADLRYRIAEAGYATTGARLPDNVAYVVANGTTYQASALTLDGTASYMLFGNGNVLGVEWRRDTGTPIGNPFDVVFYDSSDTPFSAVPNLLVPRALADRASNRVTPADATALTLTLPAAVPGHMRDLIVRLDLTALAIAPEVTFVAPAGETVTFETEDGMMPELEAGKVNLVSFSETDTGVIDVAHKTMQEVAS